MRILPLLAVLLVLAPWNAAQAGGTLRMAHDLGSGGAETMDPYDGNRFWPTINLVFNRLMGLGPDLQPVPELATAWHGNADMTVWTIELREGVKFHDGSDFDADDAVYSFKRMIDPDFDSPVLAVLGIIQDVRAVDAHTVELALSEPEADMPLLLTDYRVLMTPEGSGDTIASAPIGTGPFKVDTIDIEGVTKLSAYSDYFRGTPNLDGIEVVAIPDTAARVQALLAGQLDMLIYADGKQSAMFGDPEKYTIQQLPSGDWVGLVMRTDTAPYDNPKVRKALRIAVDRQALTDLVLGPNNGSATCDTPVWEGDPYYWDGTCEKDVAGAKKLLADAGYPEGIDIDIYTSDIEENFVTLVEAYQAQVKDAGIRVNLVMTSADGYWDDVWMKEPFVVTSWGQRPAPQILNEAYRSNASWNETFWNRPDYDALIDKARSEPDFEGRRAAYVAAQKLLFEEGGAFIPFHQTVTRVFSARVKNVGPAIIEDVRWDMVDIE